MQHTFRYAALVTGALALAATTAGAASHERARAASPDETVLVSRPSGTAGLADADSFHTTISGNGRLVTFMSRADNLVPGDNNNQYDVFVRDVETRTTTVASRSSGFGPPDSDGRSSWPAISANGRYVAFQSFADNLVPGDSNGRADVFVRDLRTGATRLVSRPDRSGTRLGDGNSLDPSISADGRYVAFQSFAGNLVRGDTNGRADVFVRDLRTGRTRLVSGVSHHPGQPGNGEADNPSISERGRYVAFESTAGNLVRRDRNHAEDVFVYDLKTGATRLVSHARHGRSASGNGASYMASISASGRLVAFASRARNLVRGDTDGAEDVFVRNMFTGAMHLVSVRLHGRRASIARSNRTIYPSISADGRYVAFHSDAGDIVTSDSNAIGDVFVRDLTTGSTRLVSRPNGSETRLGDDYSGGPSISADGRFVAFASIATNLVEDDTNHAADIFRRALVAAAAAVGLTRQAPAASAESPSSQPCFGAASRDPERRCSNPSLRLVVFPAPQAAFKSPNWPCTLGGTAVIPVCTFGTPERRATGSVALVGDSHAAHWRAAVDVLAGVKRWHGLSLMRPGCPLSTLFERLRTELHRECVAWKRALPGWFRRHPGIRTVFTVAESGAHWVLPRGGSSSAAVRNGFIREFRRLPPSVKRLVVIRDSPKARADTAACIERAIARREAAGARCAVPRRQALFRDPAAAAAARMHSRHVQEIDLTHFFCDARRCHPVVGGALVYKDTHHLTAVFVRTLGPYLVRAFNRLPVPPGAPG